MTRQDIIKIIIKKVRVSKYDMMDAFDIFVDEIADAMRRGERVTINNLVTFIPVERNGRMGRDPQTGNIIEYPPYRGVRCVVSQTLKDAANDR